MIKINSNTDAIKKAVQLIGSNKDFAKKLGVSYACVLNWTSGKNNPSMSNCLNIEKITDGRVTRKDIFPDYPWHKEE